MVLVLDWKWLRRRRHRRRHISVKGRSSGVGASTVRAAIVDLRVGKPVIGRGRLRRKKDRMRRRVSHAPRHSINGEMS